MMVQVGCGPGNTSLIVTILASVKVRVTGVAVSPRTRGQPSQSVVVGMLVLTNRVSNVELGTVLVVKIGVPEALTMYERLILLKSKWDW
jgi:hypothetical protein